MSYIADVYRKAGLQPLPLEGTIADVLRKSSMDEHRIRSFVHMLVTKGELVRITDLLFHRAALDLLRERLETFKKESGSRIDVAAFKDLAGVSRKYAIPLLEYLDRQRITRRIGDLREIL
jgi:selenocysteine-specific elongation factor